MTELKNHPGKWLEQNAAKAFDRMEAERGKIGVNSAGRTEAEQQGLINRWDRGGPGNRPPALYPPARPASSSNHVKKGGIAFDTSDWRKVAVYAPQYGFSHPYPGGDPVHFEFVGQTAAVQHAGGAFNAKVLERQKFLNSRRGEDLVEDGRLGPRTKAAIKRYQSFLKKSWGYSGAIDGDWGNGTQAAHARYTSSGKPTPPPATNRFGLSDVRGLQKIARIYGYTGGIDNVWGDGSEAGFKTFLRVNYHGSMVEWLRKRWGYKGNDVYGPVMKAALQRANAENFKAL